jgi:histone acetyltransferase (RNA polymerase elongator complex component)
VGEVVTLRLKSVRSRPLVQGRGRGRCLAAEATEVSEGDGEGQVSEVEGGVGIRSEGRVFGFEMGGRYLV